MMAGMLTTQTKIPIVLLHRGMAILLEEIEAHRGVVA
jgi:hypothetical protein